MGAKPRKKVGGLRASTGASRSPFPRVSIEVPARQWQVSFLGLMDACAEAQARAKAEGVTCYVLKYVHDREATHYGVVDEEVFLMCGGHSGWGRPVVTYNAQGEPNGNP